jgi:hypothetical protein
MHEHEALQVLEARQGEVRGIDRLRPFSPLNAHTHIRLLQHGHVVRAVSNGQRDRALLHGGVRAHQLNQLRFLQRGRAAGYHRPALCGQLK